MYSTAPPSSLSHPHLPTQPLHLPPLPSPAPHSPAGLLPAEIQSRFILLTRRSAVTDTSCTLSLNSSLWAKRWMYKQGSVNMGGRGGWRRGKCSGSAGRWIIVIAPEQMVLNSIQHTRTTLQYRGSYVHTYIQHNNTPHYSTPHHTTVQPHYSTAPLQYSPTTVQPHWWWSTHPCPLTQCRRVDVKCRRQLQVSASKSIYTNLQWRRGRGKWREHHNKQIYWIIPCPLCTCMWAAPPMWVYNTPTCSTSLKSRSKSEGEGSRRHNCGDGWCWHRYWGTPHTHAHMHTVT